MSDQELKIKSDIVGRFPQMESHIKITRVRRIFMDVTKNDFSAVLSFIVDKCGFSILCAITGLDENDVFGIMYNLANESGIMLNLELRIPKQEPLINTITGIFINADIYERELVDLFGITVEGLAPGKRYPLPDGWPEGQYPLKKDFNEEVLVEKEAK
jgi:membrane-bound hydrogenase subunit beta